MLLYFAIYLPMAEAIYLPDGKCDMAFATICYKSPTPAGISCAQHISSPQGISKIPKRDLYRSAQRALSSWGVHQLIGVQNQGYRAVIDGGNLHIRTENALLYVNTFSANLIAEILI